VILPPLAFPGLKVNWEPTVVEHFNVPRCVSKLKS